MQEIPTWVLAAVWFATHVTRPEIEHSAAASTIAAAQFLVILLGTAAFMAIAPLRRVFVRAVTGGEDSSVLAWPIFATTAVYLIEQVVLASYSSLDYGATWAAPITIAFALVVCVAALGKLDVLTIFGLLLVAGPGSLNVTIDNFTLLPLEAIGWAFALGSPQLLQKVGYGIGFAVTIAAIGVAGTYPIVTELPQFDYRHSVPLNVLLWSVSTLSAIVLTFRLNAVLIAAASAALVPVMSFLEQPSDPVAAGLALASLLGLCVLASRSETRGRQAYAPVDRGLEDAQEKQAPSNIITRIPWSTVTLFVTTVLAIFGTHLFKPTWSPAGSSITSLGRTPGSKVAALLETRLVPLLAPTIAHFLVTIPEDWPIVLWVTDEIKTDLLRTRRIGEELDTGRLTINVLPVEQSANITDGETLSQFMARPWFWAQFPQEYMFFFQTDGVMCSAANTTLDEWLGYTWVGAPTTWSEDGYPENHSGGNGGMSMRHIPTMLDITSDPDYARQPFDPVEDEWFINSIRAKYGSRAKWPADRDQREFSCSFAGPNGIVRPLIYHSGCPIGPLIEDYCPEIGIVRAWERHVKGWAIDPLDYTRPVD